MKRTLNASVPFSAHVQTMVGHFWPAGLDERRFPVERKRYRTEAEVQVLVESQRPAGRA